MALRHILRIHDTEANLISNLKDKQIAYATDIEEAMWREGTDFHYLSSGKKWDGVEYVYSNVDANSITINDNSGNSVVIDYDSLVGQQIPTPVEDGSFVIKNTDGTILVTDGSLAGELVWDDTNSKFVLSANLEVRETMTVTDVIDAQSGQIFASTPTLDEEVATKKYVDDNAGGAVDSVFGRTGAVVSALGDYTSSLVTNLSVITGSTVTDALNLIDTILQGFSTAILDLGNNKLDDVDAGTNITIDKSNPLKPVISATGGGGSQDLESVLTEGNTSTLGATFGDVTQVRFTDSEFIVGDNTNTTNDNEVGIRTQTHSNGNTYSDFKTELGRLIYFRCGEGAELGSTHNFMLVDPTDGSVTFPNSNLGGVGTFNHQFNVAGTLSQFVYANVTSTIGDAMNNDFDGLQPNICTYSSTVAGMAIRVNGKTGSALKNVRIKVMVYNSTKNSPIGSVITENSLPNSAEWEELLEGLYVFPANNGAPEFLKTVSNPFSVGTVGDLDPSWEITDDYLYMIQVRLTDDSGWSTAPEDIVVSLGWSYNQ